VNANLPTQLLKAWNDHDLPRIASFYAPDFVGLDVNRPAPYYGPEGARGAAQAVFAIFPDLLVEGDCLVTEGDGRMAALWTARGTHSGGPMSIPATGRKVSLRGASFFEITDGRIVRAQHLWDLAGLLRSLGLLPDL
jgi:steroid delta-isomerase-like uncharacterized protein